METSTFSKQAVDAFVESVAPSVLWRRTRGFTYSGLTVFTQWPSPSNLRCQ